MTLVPVQLPNKSNPARFKQGGSAALINCYAEKIGDEGKVKWAVYASDGLQGFCFLQDVDEGLGCRAGINVDGVLYVVAGTRLYKITSNGNQTLIGSMNISETEPVFIERNRRSTPDILIACDGLAYNCRADVLTQVTDGDLLAPLTLAFSDGYFGITTAENKWQLGAIDDATAWDGLDYDRADANPDALVRIAALQGQFMLFNQESTEFWTDTGAADFPYQRSTSIDIGLLASNSVASIDQTLAFVAHDKTVRILRGYTAENISTSSPKVEADIQALADPTTISATSWVSGGHSFYKITCPSWTWVYDTSTGFWHQRQTNGALNWRVSFIVPLGTKLIAGDADTGALFEMSPAFFDDAGAVLVSTIICPPVHAFPYATTHNALYIDVQKGVGTGQGATQDVNPEIMLDWSHDGGSTFGTQRTLSLGAQGQNLVRVRTHRLGQAPQDGRVYRLSWSAGVMRALYAMSADLEKDAA